MKTIELFEKITKGEIKSGTFFEVFKDEEKIGEIGVMKTTATFHEFKYFNEKGETIEGIPPVDLWLGEYEVKEMKDK